jgi:hypothetical protein
MALTGTSKLARDGVVEFAKPHPLAVLSEFNPDNKVFAAPKTHGRHTFVGGQRLHSAVINKHSLPAESTNLAYAMEDLEPFSSGLLQSVPTRSSPGTPLEPRGPPG